MTTPPPASPDPGTATPSTPTSAPPTPTAPGTTSEVSPEAVARAVQACADVVDLDGGRFGEVASYLPGRRVDGVRVDDDGVHVQVVMRWGATVADVFAQVAAATRPLRGAAPLRLAVTDISAPPGETPPDADTANAPAAALPAAAEPPAIEAPPAGRSGRAGRAGTAPKPVPSDPAPESSTS